MVNSKCPYGNSITVIQKFEIKNLFNFAIKLYWIWILIIMIIVHDVAMGDVIITNWTNVIQTKKNFQRLRDFKS